MNNEIRFLKQESYRIDRKLYKYFANLEYAYDCILNKRIHLESPEYYNDPFDSTYSERTFGYGNRIQTLQEWLYEIYGYILINMHDSRHVWIMWDACTKLTKSDATDQNKLSECYKETEVLHAIYSLFDDPRFTENEFRTVVTDGSIEQRKSNCSMSCFSEEWNSLPLWSYYANKHKGICLEFDLTKLDPSVSINQGILSNIRPVHYSNVRPDYLSNASNEQNLSNFLFTKADAWSHEHEWRLILTGCERDYIPFDCLSGIYCGVECDKNRKATIKDMIKDMYGVTLYQCKMAPFTYEINATAEYNDCARYMERFILENENPNEGN